ncbi:hypothetical protein [Rathayibacter iranicus]|uniref:hypothetical protein n=1 Tax=Rathayibacter iranicus TaxID=59737 RepID=UPI00132606C1|nr:hypothetical protein [Rathayibacter iranicus]MWV31967.1 hypothetical protein [Rathayibacter iranicus NCPPB 2253 = VKM Ac-1602]
MLKGVDDNEQPNVESALGETTAVIDATLLSAIHLSDFVARNHHDAHSCRKTG